MAKVMERAMAMVMRRELAAGLGKRRSQGRIAYKGKWLERAGTI
jgi:hypothetical protein